MKRGLFGGYLIFIIFACGLTSAFAKGPPSSAEQLRNELESALKAKDTNAIISLFYWEGVPEADKEMMIGAFVMNGLLRTNVTGIKFSPLSTNLQALVSDERNDWQGDNGQRVKYSVTVLGELDVSTPEEHEIRLPYGKMGDFFYLAAFITYRAHGKSLDVRVLGLPPSGFTGTWVYVKGGKEITVNFSDHTNRFRQGWGDYIKSCTVQRTSTNINPRSSFYFEISEGVKTIFKSPKMTNGEPVTYEGNHPPVPPVSAEQIQNEIESQIKARDAEWREYKARMARMVPVRISYRIADDCVIALQSNATNTLSLTVTAIEDASEWETKATVPRTNTCQVDLKAGETKEIDLLRGWILIPDDRVRVEVADPRYVVLRIWIGGCRTPSQKIAEQQDTTFKTFSLTKDQSGKDRNAQILSKLWRAGLLKDEIKDQLVEEHYQLVLRQILERDGRPSWDIQCHQTFPFPDVYTKFIKTRFLNGQIKYFASEPHKSDGAWAMSATSSAWSESGGEYKNGDVVQFKIELNQTINGRSWKKSLWTNKIELQGLKN